VPNGRQPRAAEEKAGRRRHRGRLRLVFGGEAPALDIGVTVCTPLGCPRDCRNSDAVRCLRCPATSTASTTGWRGVVSRRISTTIPCSPTPSRRNQRRLTGWQVSS